MRYRLRSRDSALAVSLASSLAFHASVALAAAYYGLPLARLRIAPIEPGQGSIALVASLASAGQNDEGEIALVDPTVQVDLPLAPEASAPRRDDEQLHAAQQFQLAEVVVRQIVELDPPPRLRIELDKLDEPPPAVPAEVDPQPADRTESAALPEAMPAPELKIERVEEAMRSAPSAGSVAVAGADVERQPVTTFNPGPSYPPSAWRMRQSGRVRLAVTVSAEGTVLAASVYQSSGVKDLDDAALAAVRRWRFEPATRAGVAVEHTVSVPIRFTLQQ